jgi:hypothetical protein
MDHQHLTEEVRDLFQERLDELGALLNEATGGACDIVMLVHKQHDGQRCNGTALFTTSPDMAQVLKMMQQAGILVMANIAENSAPPDATIQ